MRRLKEELCPESSNIAWAMGFVNALRDPVLYIEADLALRKAERAAQRQELLPFHSGPMASLRAVHVTQNSAARANGLFVPLNMRIPEQSVIRLALKGTMN